MGALLQPVPFPDEAFALKEVQQSILMCVINRLAKDTRCVVHRVLLPVRESRPGWIHIAAPSSPDCPDQGELFGEMVSNFIFTSFFFLSFYNINVPNVLHSANNSAGMLLPKKEVYQLANQAGTR